MKELITDEIEVLKESVHRYRRTLSMAQRMLKANLEKESAPQKVQNFEQRIRNLSRTRGTCTKLLEKLRSTNVESDKTTT